MAKDTATCPYCAAKSIEVKAGALRPHLLGGKDGADRCDGSGLDVTRLSAPAGQDEGRTEAGSKGDKP